MLDEHSRAVIESLIVFERILLDGPSVERNANALQWLADIEDGIEILDITPDNEGALYASAASLARHMSLSGSIENFLRMYGVPCELAQEAGERFGASTNWWHLQHEMKSEDLRNLHRILSGTLGRNIKPSSGAFVAIARSLYYLCLQGSIGSSLMLDPMKGLDTSGTYPFYINRTTVNCNAGQILSFFDSEVRKAFITRKNRWLGETPRSLRLPLLANYIEITAERHDWSIGRAILQMRQSREVELFRSGLAELQTAIDNNDAVGLDAIFTELDAAAEAWSKQLGVARKQQRSDTISVSVSLPFVGVSKSLPLPRFPTRSTSDKLLVFVSQLLSAT